MFAINQSRKFICIWPASMMLSLQSRKLNVTLPPPCCGLIFVSGVLVSTLRSDGNAAPHLLRCATNVDFRTNAHMHLFEYQRAALLLWGLRKTFAHVTDGRLPQRSGSVLTETTLNGLKKESQAWSHKPSSPAHQ